MRLKVILPPVEPDVYARPEECPHGCGGQYYKPRGVPGERKPLRDLQYVKGVCIGTRVCAVGGASGSIRVAWDQGRKVTT